jgi:hypothetical protein
MFMLLRIQHLYVAVLFHWNGLDMNAAGCRGLSTHHVAVCSASERTHGARG